MSVSVHCLVHFYVHEPVHSACSSECLYSTDMHNGHATGTWSCTAAWTRTYRMSRDMQHGHGRRHAAWTSTCSMGMDMRHGHGHTAWTRTCSIVTDMDTQHGHRRGHGARTWTCILVLCVKDKMYITEPAFLNIELCITAKQNKNFLTDMPTSPVIPKRFYISMPIANSI
jgi:hypothetical protein